MICVAFVLHSRHMPKLPPAPEALGERPRGSNRTLTFRLNESDHAALLKLAKRASVGHATLVRRIVEHYINQHTPARNK